jgi:midasin (ATPase involved in ribosome maturation)
MYAHLRGQPYYRQLFTAGTDGMQLVGGYDHLGWKDGLLLTAGRPENVPGIYLADEFNVGSAAAQERFNSVLDDERKVVLAEKEGEEIRLNKDYRFVAAMNPPTQAYGGREKLSKAMQNRLTVIWVPDLKEKNELLEVALGRAKQMGVQPAIAEALVELHTWVVDAYQEGLHGKDVRERDRPVYSIRQLMAALEMVAEFQGEKGPADAYLYAVETCYASSGEAVEDSAVIVDKAKEIGE